MSESDNSEMEVYPEILKSKYKRKSENVINPLLGRELGTSKATGRKLHSKSIASIENDFFDSISENVPNCLHERITIPGIQNVDKIFASCWLNEENVCFGTKDNKFVSWNHSTNSYKTIPLPVRTAEDTAIADGCGIHFISTNNCSEYLATGSTNPSDIAIFGIPSFNAELILQGHEDWVFSAEFVSNDVLVSGSRDCTVKIWKISDAQKSDAIEIREPVITRQEHTRKVRDLKYNDYNKELYTVSADSTVKIWDVANFDIITSIELKQAHELVCLSVDKEKELIAVGTQFYTYILDSRTSQIIYSIPSKDADWGIRSVAFRDHIISVGGGMGYLSFFDLRKGSFIKMNINSKTNEMTDVKATGKGWIDRDYAYYTHYNGMDVPHSIYTHTFSPSKSKLFIGGGPLMLGLKGSYGAIWC